MTNAVSEIVLAPNEKRCSKCKEVKDRGEFHLKRNSRTGIASECKDCYKNSYYLRRSGDCKRKDITSLTCPLCKLSFQNLLTHVQQTHKLGRDDLLTFGISDYLSKGLHDSFTKARRGKPQLGNRTGDIAVIRNEGITFPKSYWPAECKYTRVVLDRVKRQLQFNPITSPKRIGTKRIHSLGKRSHRLQVLISKGLLNSIETTIEREAITLREGAGFYIQFKEGDEYLLDILEFWVKHSRSMVNTSLLSSFPNNKNPTLTIADHIWPLNAEYVLLDWKLASRGNGYDYLDIYPVKRNGDIVGGIKLGVKGYGGLDGALKLSRSGNRLVISATRLFKYNLIPEGNWELQKYWGSLQQPTGAFRFVHVDAKAAKLTSRAKPPKAMSSSDFDKMLAEFEEQPKEQSEDIAS